MEILCITSEQELLLAGCMLWSLPCGTTLAMLPHGASLLDRFWGERKHGADPQPTNAASGTGGSNKPGLVQAAEICCCYLITYTAYSYSHTHTSSKPYNSITKYVS